MCDLKHRKSWFVISNVLNRVGGKQSSFSTTFVFLLLDYIPFIYIPYYIYI